ncbi:hypothetical protein FF1_030298 [Malus domestica]
MCVETHLLYILLIVCFILGKSVRKSLFMALVQSRLC